MRDFDLYYTEWKCFDSSEYDLDSYFEQLEPDTMIELLEAAFEKIEDLTGELDALCKELDRESDTVAELEDRLNTIKRLVTGKLAEW